MARSNALIKIAVALAVLAGLGFLFVRSVRNARSEPYTVERERLRGWTVALEPASSPNDPMLVLRPPPELASGLFHQVFVRSMESLNQSNPAAIPLVLQGEFDRAFAGRATPDALVAAARSAGLDSAAMKPRCLAYRRVSAPGRRSTRIRFESATGEAVSLAAAVGKAFEVAKPSGVVLLAPACASFDMFRDYAERGRMFKEEVARIADRER